MEKHIETRLNRRPAWLRLLFLLVAIAISGCGQAAVPQPALPPTEAATATAVPTATMEPTQAPSPTLEPTATAEPTATPVPPTATPVPELAVLENGFNVWCAGIDYAGTKAQGPDEPEYARKMTKEGDLIVASIPASYCVLVYQFNQPAPEGLRVEFAEGKSPAFLSLPLAAADGKPDTAWTSVAHAYVINPPLWWVDYNLTVVRADGKQVWSSPVRFTKPLPETCIYGGLPDPVTLYCDITDPWEIEPHPNITYPYDRSRLTPDP